jgi:hypothetical protein
VEENQHIIWRGHVQRVAKVEGGCGLPWPAGVEWREFKLDPPDMQDGLVFGFPPALVVRAETLMDVARLSGATVRPPKSTMPGAGTVRGGHDPAIGAHPENYRGTDGEY